MSPAEGCVHLTGSVEEDVQFRHFGNPTTVDFAVQLNRELHSDSILAEQHICRERLANCGLMCHFTG